MLGPDNMSVTESQGMSRGEVPEVGAEVKDLPDAQARQCSESDKRKPLHTLVRALVRISELLLTASQVLHLSHNLSRQLLNPPQLQLNRLQLLRRLDSRPIPRISSDIHVQLNCPGGSPVRAFTTVSFLFLCAFLADPGRDVATVGKDILEADVEGGVGVGGECDAGFAHNVLLAAVLISNSIANLYQSLAAD